MFNAIVDSVVSGGVNNIDTSINFRYMKSERTVGAALKHLFENLEYTRDEIFVASKGGYIIGNINNFIHIILYFYYLLLCLYILL